MRLAAYTGASVALAATVILKALDNRPNFYSVCVHIAQSNACLMILINLALLCTSIVVLALQRVLYGPLRPIEVEQLYEKAWFAVTETCLAMTIFREDVGIRFLFMFVSLLIGKVWMWIGDGRIEILEQQPPPNPRIFHIRVSCSLFLSTIFDLYMVYYSIEYVLQHTRPDMMIMFAFEFAVLLVGSLATIAKYLIILREMSVIARQTTSRRAEILHEMRNASTDHDQQPSIDHMNENDISEPDVPGWIAKGRWVFYVDLVFDLMKLLIYLTFFGVLCMFYGMPIHIIRDVALTIRSFHKRVTDFIRYRQATRDMHSRYPDANQEDIAHEDCCIICRENMTPWDVLQQGTVSQRTQSVGHAATSMQDERQRPKKLPCGHVLHFACLRSWLERQQICPTCRAPVLRTRQNLQLPQNIAPLSRNNNNSSTQNSQQHGPVNGRRSESGSHQIRLGPIRIAFGARRAANAAQPVHSSVNDINATDTARVVEQDSSSSMNADITVMTRDANSAQLRRIEGYLNREIESLQLQASQLFLVQSLQDELRRLRGVESDLMTRCSEEGLSNSSVLDSWATEATAENSITASGTRELDLPIGLVIPSDWTMVPLQRLGDGENE